MTPLQGATGPRGCAARCRKMARMPLVRAWGADRPNLFVRQLGHRKAAATPLERRNASHGEAAKL